MALWNLNDSEWYPVLTLNQLFPEETQAEFSGEEVAEFNRVMVEFNACQQKIAERFGRRANEYHLTLIIDEPCC